jgi:hypothetical protein
MLNDWLEGQDYALKQRATEAFTTAFEEILQTHALERLQAEFVSRLAAVCQAMEDLAGVAETTDSVVEWVEAMAMAKGES